MTTSERPIRALVHLVDDLSLTRSATRSYRRWAAAEPALAGYGDLSGLTAAGRAAAPPEQDRLLGALLRVAAGDPLAEQAAVAILSRGLGAVVAGWTRVGIGDPERADMEAELVAGCWEAVSDLAHRVAGGATVPDRVGLRLIDRARESVRGPRRRQHRETARRHPLDLPPTAAAGPDGRPVCEALALAVSGAVRAGRLRAEEARPVFLTRVAGFDVNEAARRLGCSAATLRAQRSRAERRLVAAGA